MSPNVNLKSEITKIGIIGGGKVGLQLYNLFSTSTFTQVEYIVDKEIDAPAIIAAKQNGIATYTDFSQAFQRIEVDFIFEVTGSGRVVEYLRQELDGQPTQLVTHDMAFVLIKVIEENRAQVTNLVRIDFEDIQGSILASLEAMAGTVNSIKEMTSDLRYLAMNARIEAAHAGDSGKGFDIVAQQVERLAGQVRSMAEEIETVNTNISSVSARIESSLRKLV